MESKFEQVLRAENPVNYTDIRADIIERSVTLKITLRERRKKKLCKFKRKKHVVRQPKRSSNNVSDFIELALQRSKFKNVTDNRKQRKKERSNLKKEKNDLFPVEISDVRNSSLNEAMQSTLASSSSRGMISDASTVKFLKQNVILNESEEQVSLVKDVFKGEAALREKREDRVDHSYNHDGVGFLPIQETIREVIQGVNDTVKISVLDTQDQDQELSEIKLSQNDSSLVEILRNLLNDENCVNVVTHSGSIGTADLVSAQGNCTSSFEKSAVVLEKEVQFPVNSRRLKAYFC